MSTQSIQDIEARRAARKAATELAREEQRVKDMEALDSLEIEHGDGRVVAIDLGFFDPGLPTFVVARMPAPIERKRYEDMCVRKTDGAALEAAKMLASVCVVYPDKDTYEKVKERCTGIHTTVALEAIQLGAGKRREEGKG